MLARLVTPPVTAAPSGGDGERRAEGGAGDNPGPTIPGVEAAELDAGAARGAVGVEGSLLAPAAPMAPQGRAGA